MAPQILGRASDLPVRYGDIAKVDLVKLLHDSNPDLAHLGREAFKHFNLLDMTFTHE